MGTTATLLHIDEQEGQAYWAHVGDSRLYLLRCGAEAVAQITRDHSYVEDLVREGTITPEEAKKHPQRNMLTRAVGVMENLAVDSGQLAVQDGDIFLLATDGLMKHVEDEAITRILREAVDNPAQALLNAALAAGGTDNITVVVVSLA
jgi:protein phosphatase